jgi:hypothetical protein
MTYDTYATLLNKRLVIPSEKTSYVAVDRTHFALVLRPHIARIRVDTKWYLGRYPDVSAAIDRGEFESATDHYVKVGYFEHRMPHPIEVDEGWYVTTYPDIAAAVEKGVFTSGALHFERLGFREGRFPYSGFRLHCDGSP